ncbi:MAG: nitroreductase family deazaflavin-dependent oxidoreductase [Chloroflexota bacterium]|nr:nitroreductase family deazaflavin-dependent oxidoreductase [Chloroflexota bacterium]
MADDIRNLLKIDEVVDITTTGRKTGEPRRIEIRLHVLDGKLYLTGRPGMPRSWYANMMANPAVTVHLKQTLVQDVPSTASAVRDPDERRRVFSRMLELESRMSHVDPEVWAETAPLVELTPA